MAHPTPIKIAPPTSKKGRPRTYLPTGYVTSGGGAYYFAPVTDYASTPYGTNLPRFEVSPALGQALVALTRDPGRSYEEVGRACGFVPDAEGNCSAPMSRAIKALCKRAADLLAGRPVAGAKPAKPAKPAA
jgi:hypothetical protein